MTATWRTSSATAWPSWAWGGPGAGQVGPAQAEPGRADPRRRRTSTRTRRWSGRRPRSSGAGGPARSSSPRARGTAATPTSSSSSRAWARCSTRTGIEFVDLNHDDVDPVAQPAAVHAGWTALPCPATLRRADLIVSLPKLKTHHWAGVTLSMKNLFGVMPGVCYGWPKNVLHHAGIPQSILDINAAVRPHLAIVDGIVGMEGDGPIMGTPAAAGRARHGHEPPGRRRHGRPADGDRPLAGRLPGRPRRAGSGRSPSGTSASAASRSRGLAQPLRAASTTPASPGSAASLHPATRDRHSDGRTEARPMSRTQTFRRRCTRPALSGQPAEERFLRYKRSCTSS